MADDKTRLIGQTERIKQSPKKHKDGSGVVPLTKHPSMTGSGYGTWDHSSTAPDVTAPTDPEQLPSPRQRYPPLSPETSKPSQPSVTLSSSPSASPVIASRNPSTDSQQTLETKRAKESTNNSCFTQTQTNRESLPNVDSEIIKNDNSNSHSNVPIAEQPAASIQSSYKGTTQNSSSFNTNNEYQENSSLDNTELNKVHNLNNLVHESVALPQNVNDKSRDEVDGSRSKKAIKSYSRNAKIESDQDQQAVSEGSHLLVTSGMDRGSYDGQTHIRRVQDENRAKGDEKTPFFVYYLACFATIGGFLFGYDTGIVSGAMLLIKDYFRLNTIWQELIVSGTVGAAAVFSLLSGFLCDCLGRKITIMIASVVFVAGAVIMGVSDSATLLLIGRIVVGVGIGFASMTVPIYIAEASPPAIRGRLVTLNQLFITIGIVVSSVVAGLFSSLKTTGWRYMLGLAGVPGVIQFIGFLYLPESPRWLVMKGKEDRATKVLQRIRGKDDVYDEMKEIIDSVNEDKKHSGFVLGRVMRTAHVRRALFVGCGLQLFQQLCGINTIIYYSATILTMSGFPTDAAIWLVLVPNSINFLATFIGIALVERLGRKKLLVASFMGVVTALVVLAVGFQLSANFSPSINQNVTEISLNGTYSIVDDCYNKNYINCEQCIEDTDCGFCFTGSGEQGSCLKVQKNNEDTLSTFGRCQNETVKSALRLKFSHGYCPTDYTWMAVLGLALFVLAFAPGLGPMPWTINSEIYPMWARSTCSAMSTGTNWICNLIVSLFFLTLTETITKYGAFWLFCAICFLGMIFTIAFLPETKNKSLEEVEELFKRSKKQGVDNLGYEPASVGSNTKL